MRFNESETVIELFRCLPQGPRTISRDDRTVTLPDIYCDAPGNAFHTLCIDRLSSVSHYRRMGLEIFQLSNNTLNVLFLRTNLSHNVI